MEGNIVASIEKVPGHLGAMTISPVDGNVYASLECLDDSIGKGIAKSLGMQNYTREQSTMYIAVIDVDKLSRIGMDSSDDNVLRTFCVRTATEDYLTGFHGCSGIDGVAFVPGKGKKPNWQLCVAYGIYGKIDRDDNDCQILLTYDIRSLDKYLTPVNYSELHRNGPSKPSAKYYIYTGNTMYGVQNLAYDEHTGKLFMFVYRGRKPQYANCDFFTVDWKPKSFATTYEDAVKSAQPLGGWKFKWGSTGVSPIGDGYWLISENARNKADKTNSCNARLYKWDPLNVRGPFIKVSDLR